MSEPASTTTFDAGALVEDFLCRRSSSAASVDHPASQSLIDFGFAAYPGFQAARHHIAIAETLERVERGELDRVIIETPPRHGKSTITSHLFPSWYLGRNPHSRIIACSYSADLAYDMSRKARNTLESEEFSDIFPEVKIAPDARAVKAWNIANHKGGYVAAGIGGPVTGRGAHLLLIDDPLKSAEEAGSQTILDNIWEWYGATAYTRLQKGGAVVIVMTRWAEGDLTGRLLQAARDDPEADQWHVLHLPANAEENDPLGRELGEALWPEEFPVEELRRREVTLGARSYAALYQQRPSPADGGLFKRHWWGRFAAFDRSQATQIIQVWDTAFSAKETADYSVCSTWALTNNRALVLDVFRARLEYPDLQRKAMDLFAHWRPVAVLIENKASGQSLIQTLTRETLMPVIAVDVDKDKVSRANAVTPWVESNRVAVPESAPWVDGFIEEHAAFPTGAYDDMVDTTSMALLRLFGTPRAFRDEDMAAMTADAPAPDEELFA